MKIPLNENRVEWGTLKSYDNVELSREDDYVGTRPKKARARQISRRTKLCCLFVCRSRSFRRQVKDNIIADEAMREVLTSGEDHILVVLSVFEM